MKAAERLANAINAVEQEIAKMQVGDVRCQCCGAIRPQSDLYRGRGRSIGEHPDHEYIKGCGHDVTWHGYLVKGADGRVRKAA